MADVPIQNATPVDLINTGVLRLDSVDAQWVPMILITGDCPKHGKIMLQGVPVAETHCPACLKEWLCEQFPLS